MSILYRPSDAWAADFIPFHWDGLHHLFYLKDWRDVPGHGEGTPWWHIVTQDFVGFEDRGEALPRGTEGSQDRWVFTGSVIERNGTFHIFYTGHNHHLKDSGKPIQGVMHATGPDLAKWTKRGEFLFLAPTEQGFEPDDWRDPFVFWNDEVGEYWMLLAARKKEGPSRNRGCTALAVSPDLGSWTPRGTFWAPDLYYTHECPDLFRIGEWWYLLYSTFSERQVTHYRMARSLSGPWLAPANDAFDGRAYYAAKSAGDGRKRFLFGWLPSRDGENDTGGWQWGGELVVHEMVQRDDGTLAVRMPETIGNAFARPVPCAPQPVLGTWSIGSAIIEADATSCHSVLSFGTLPETCLVQATVTFQPGTYAFGMVLRADEAFDHYYVVRLEPANDRMVFDRWPRPGDQPFMIERPLVLQPGRSVRLRILVDGTCLVAYANDEVALSCRMYDHRSGRLGLFVSEGKARFEDMTVRCR